ncbi:hypothetical protein LWP59_08475 [Amycolatopsis acidiphila]|uniref:Uncharacterized protein n=1 Tax=Amycolatopsis acidiphila TaxID=715473 RepID=A0A558AD09_9PSEU|nr:hypothetical protein [Amycolatopsis acidiphila]TVT22156.1 hypothetical protein FNH06_14410 [Amycolatopsis acidiphila]UIJ61645.1 hypothetical protein LWP59_08475 [Amycolatopsis acidiphila]GHG58688.1 hypothetical protein GCM10017788_11530 [Amycolatopsis acidiphila]
MTESTRSQTTELHVPDAADRETLSAFVARAVRLDGQCAVRLRNRDEEVVEAWVVTPFEVLATRAVHGRVAPRDVTVSGNELLAALTVAPGEWMDPGPSRDLLWHAELPVGGQWQQVDDLPVGVVGELTDRGVTLARDNVGPHGTPPASLMDQTVLTVTGGELEVKIPMRCLFALSGMGFVDSSIGEDVVRVTATSSWLRLDARYGAVLRRRQALLPLLF